MVCINFVWDYLILSNLYQIFLDFRLCILSKKYSYIFKCFENTLKFKKIIKLRNNLIVSIWTKTNNTLLLLYLDFCEILCFNLRFLVVEKIVVKIGQIGDKWEYVYEKKRKIFI